MKDLFFQRLACTVKACYLQDCLMLWGKCQKSSNKVIQYIPSKNFGIAAHTLNRQNLQGPTYWTPFTEIKRSPTKDLLSDVQHFNKLVQYFLFQRFKEFEQKREIGCRVRSLKLLLQKLLPFDQRVITAKLGESHLICDN